MSTNYLFNIGSPTYSLSRCEISCKEEEINMIFYDEIKAAHFDGQALTAIPKDAITYSVILSDIRSTAIKYARMENEKKSLR